MSKKRVKWNFGDVFVIELSDGMHSIGQVLDLQTDNIVRCALFGKKFNSIDDIVIEKELDSNNLVSLVATTREQLDYNVWKTVGNYSIRINSNRFPNEEFRQSGWIGAQIYDAAIVEEFINAFHGLIPWDDWADPNFLDELLIDHSKKPSNLKYK